MKRTYQAVYKGTVADTFCVKGAKDEREANALANQYVGHWYPLHQAVVAPKPQEVLRS